MYEQTKYKISGDKGLLVEFGNSISYELNNKVRAFTFALEKAGLPGLIEYIPAYCSVLIIYDPLVWKPKEFISRLEELEEGLNSIQLPEPAVYHLPVAYGKEFGPDLSYISDYTGLATEEIIKVHTGSKYLIFMLGFTPGFPYLGGMDNRIATPRLDTPRTNIPAGSVGIAGNQTGVYPVESPGGWRLIGRTPVKLFDPYSENPILLNAGDYISFFEITHEEYWELAEQVSKDTYEIKVTRYAGEVDKNDNN